MDTSGWTAIENARMILRDATPAAIVAVAALLIEKGDAVRLAQLLEMAKKK